MFLKLVYLSLGTLSPPKTMSLFKNKFRTESNRLQHWDYSSEAIYFITIVTQNRECIFGQIEEDKMIFNDNGKIIETELMKSIEIRPYWIFHNWVVMPNHIHLLVEIKNNNLSVMDLHTAEKRNVETHDVETHDVETHCSASQQNPEKPKLSRKPNSISSFVAIFKSVTTKQIKILTHYNDSIWQSNYHDHIVRNFESFNKIFHYIKNNPKNWNNDLHR